MLQELQRRNYSQTTVTSYIKIVADFAKYFQRPPDQLGPDDIRAYQLHLLNERKQGARTVGTQTAAWRFFCCNTLKRNYPDEEVPYPKAPRRLPIILTQEEAIRLIDSASNLFHRAMLMTLYSTGMRRAELCHLQVADIDSVRMLIHIRHGKRNRDRNVPMSPKLLKAFATTGAGISRSTIYSRVRLAIAAWINRLPTKPSGMPAGRRLRSEPACASGLARTLCATLRHTTPPFRVRSF